MPIRKVRKQKRIHRAIEEWRESHVNKDLLASMAYYRNTHDYVKFRIYPWTQFFVRNSRPLEPSGKTRALLLQALFDIHDSWEGQLKRAGQPYDLRIWLFHSDISASQVVVDIDGDAFHQNDFTPAKPPVAFPFSQYGKFAARLAQMELQCGMDDYNIDDPAELDPADFDTPAEWREERRRLEALVARAYDHHEYTDHRGKQTTMHFIAKGHVWICKTARPHSD